MNRRHFLGAIGALAATPALAKLAPIAEAAPAAGAAPEAVARAATTLQGSTGLFSVGDVVSVDWGGGDVTMVSTYRVTVVASESIEIAPVGVSSHLQSLWDDPASTPMEDMLRAKRAIERAPRAPHITSPRYAWRQSQAAHKAAFRAKMR